MDGGKDLVKAQDTPRSAYLRDNQIFLDVHEIIDGDTPNLWELLASLGQHGPNLVSLLALCFFIAHQ